MEYTSKSEDRKAARPSREPHSVHLSAFRPISTKRSKKFRSRKVSLAWAVRDTSENCVADPMQFVSENRRWRDYGN
jgi:hypothetical protein